MNCEPEHESVLTVPRCLRYLFSIVKEVNRGFCLLPFSQSAHHSFSHKVTRLHEQLLSQLEPVNVYIQYVCVLSETLCWLSRS